MAINADSAAEARALRKASIAALRTGTLPRTFIDMVKRRTSDVHSYRRIAYRIERRTVALRLAAAAGSRAKDVQAPPSPAGVDPWAVDPVTLPSTSEALCTCPPCAGAKKVACRACRGTARVHCSGCGGGGKVSGQRGVKNCPACRGQGTTKCSACTKGLVVCPTCDGAGRVRAWLEVCAQMLVQVRAHPQSAIAGLHRELLAPEDFDRAPDSFRVPITQDSQWIAALPQSLGLELGPTLAPVSDRVAGLRIQKFASTVHRFAYETRGGAGHVSVAGEPPEVLGDSTWGPLWRRLALAVGAALAMLILGSAVAANYVSRATWFATEGNAGPMTLLILIATVATGVAVAAQWKPAPTRRPLRASPSAWIVAVAWALIGVCWLAGGPTLAGAEQALARGSLAAAHAELDALVAVGEDAAAIAELRARVEAAETAEQRLRDVAADEMHLAEVRDAPFAAEALVRFVRPWRTPELQAQAREIALRRAREELEPRVQAEEDSALERLAELVAEFDATLARQARTRARLVRASKSHNRADYSGALAELDGVDIGGDSAIEARIVGLRRAIEVDLRRAIDEAPLEHGEPAAQREAAATALANARLYETRTGTHAAHTALALESRLERLDAAIKRERERLEAVAERARKKAEVAEQRRQAAEARAAAQRARLADRVSCCDGTLSPSCRYSQGSLRGCCSYHGGVC